MQYIRFLLLPFSGIYYLIVLIRNFLFDKRFINSYCASLPVVSIGNITTGGSGKTPLIIFLAKYFISQNKSVAIIARGYKRKTKGLLVVWDGKTLKSNPAETGDELLMITKELISNPNQFFVIASNNRIEGIKYAEKHFSPDIVLLDDAFQHRAVSRTTDIVILTPPHQSRYTFLYKFLIPVGNMREPYSSLRRADAIVINFKFSRDEKQKANYLTNLIAPHILTQTQNLNDTTRMFFTMKYKFAGFGNKDGVFDYLSQTKLILFAGIADRESFFSFFESNKYEICAKISFPDHHFYLQKDIKKLEALYVENCLYVTTQKDYVKIQAFKEFFNQYPIYYLKVDLEFDNFNLFKEKYLKF
ncbi:MAG: tetraacyldisaccharide 4'-kinase [Ignavibacteria bacterium]